MIQEPFECKPGYFLISGRKIKGISERLWSQLLKVYILARVFTSQNKWNYPVIIHIHDMDYDGIVLVFWINFNLIDRLIHFGPFLASKVM